MKRVFTKMQPTSVLSLALLLSTLSLAAPTTSHHSTRSELAARGLESEVDVRDLPQAEDGFATLARRAAWTRSQEEALKQARLKWARLNALRGRPGFDKEEWQKAQEEYQHLQAAKTANGSRVNMRRSLALDDDDVEGGALTRRTAWTRQKEAALQAARAEFGRLNAHRDTEAFKHDQAAQAAWLRAQQTYLRLQREKTDSGSTVNQGQHHHGRDLEDFEEMDSLMLRSVDFDDDEESTLVRRTWTRQKEAALLAAKAEFERLNAHRDTEAFKHNPAAQAAWLRAQQAYMRLQREKTDSGSTVNQGQHHHARDMEALEELDTIMLRSIDFDFEDDDAALVRRTWTRQKEAALLAAKAEFERLNAHRDTEAFKHNPAAQAAWLRAQQAYMRLQREKTDSGSTVNQGQHHHGRDMEDLEEMDSMMLRSSDFDDDEESTLTRRTAWTRQKEAALQAARAEFERLNAHRDTEAFKHDQAAQAAWLRAQQTYMRLQREKTDSGSTVNQGQHHHGRDLESLEELD